MSLRISSCEGSISRGHSNTLVWSLMPYCFAVVCDWAGIREKFASPTNHLLPRFLSPSGRKGSGLPQDPRGSLEVLLPCSSSESSLHTIGSSETGEIKGTSPRDRPMIGDPILVSHPAGSPVLITSTSRRTTTGASLSS